MKTVKEWLEELEEPYRRQALRNMYDQARVDKPLASEKIANSIYHAIDLAFKWCDSFEGHDYWYKFYNDSVLMNEYENS